MQMVGKKSAGRLRFPRCNAAASLKLKFSRLQEMQSNEGFRDLQP